jgi:hypothetical protein
MLSSNKGARSQNGSKDRAGLATMARQSSQGCSDICGGQIILNKNPLMIFPHQNLAYGVVGDR